MTVLFSKKCELGLQAVLYLSTLEEGKVSHSGEISEKLGVPKEFVSKVLQTLTNKGIVASRKGKHGGFYLGRDASEIKLIEIVKAIDGLESFNNCVLGFKDCSVMEPCPVHEKWGKLREEAYRMLSEESLDNLREKTISKLRTL